MGPLVSEEERAAEEFPDTEHCWRVGVPATLLAGSVGGLEV